MIVLAKLSTIFLSNQSFQTVSDFFLIRWIDFELCFDFGASFSDIIQSPFIVDLHSSVDISVYFSDSHLFKSFTKDDAVDIKSINHRIIHKCFEIHCDRNSLKFFIFIITQERSEDNFREGIDSNL